MDECLCELYTVLVIRFPSPNHSFIFEALPILILNLLLDYDSFILWAEFDSVSEYLGEGPDGYFITGSLNDGELDVFVLSPVKQFSILDIEVIN